MNKEEKEKSKKGEPDFWGAHSLPHALFDNLEFMITFTFEKVLSDNEKAEFEERVRLFFIQKLQKKQKFYFSTNHKHVNPTFKTNGFLKGTNLSVYFHFNALYLLKQELESERGVKFEKGLRMRNVNFLPPEFVTPEIKLRNVNIVIENLLVAIEWACCLIKIGANNVPCNIKFSVLHTEAVIDTRFDKKEIDD